MLRALGRRAVSDHRRSRRCRRRAVLPAAL